MKIIYLLLVGELICMYQLAFSEDGIVKLICWGLILTFAAIVAARLEKIYGAY